ncbi:hypothetical protein CLV92_10583 [Kineococcus xinjiangensis]|uniref:Uncharacterized protein n=1 Tax=Kineococcus xinjiangensis TaxID=512762 RepID=A0A2S6IP07_9ACTN|nr:hypothetical protein [Kineococcus xinjiangensis]PPK95983.1 hypothetical protein CLV92_10583 [Kineococcus xinjiangensis]
MGRHSHPVARAQRRALPPLPVPAPARDGAIPVPRAPGTLYLVGRVTTHGADGEPLRSDVDGRPVCIVEQGDDAVEFDAAEADELRRLARGVAVSEVRAELGGEAEHFLDWLTGSGLAVLDPAGDVAALEGLHLVLDLHDLEPHEEDATLRWVRTGVGAEIAVSVPTLLVLDHNQDEPLGAAVRTVVREYGLQELMVRHFLHQDWPLLLGEGGGWLVRTAAVPART